MINKYINGVRIYAPKSKEDFLSYITSYNGILIALNAEKLLKKEPPLKELINNNIGYPDGIGAVLALKRKGIKTEKIPGAEIWLDIIAKFKDSKSFYFVGGVNHVIESTIKKVKQTHPGITIKGYRNGYINSDTEEQALLDDIVYQKPDVIFIAMGTPKQEYLMNKIAKRHPALYMGLGGSFDVFTSQKKRAPKIFQKLGLEWFYRLLIQPTRIKRQVVYLKFLWLLATNKL